MKKDMLILFLLMFALVQGCGEKLKPPATRAIDNEMPDQESWDATVTFSDSGQVRAVLQAAHIQLYEMRRETLLDSGLVVDFYNRNGEHSSVLTAERGRVDDPTKNLEAFDNVVFVSDSGTVVKTDYLFWDNKQRRVRSDRFVTITSPTENLQGYGFEADQNLNNYTVYRVSGRAQLLDEEG